MEAMRLTLNSAKLALIMELPATLRDREVEGDRFADSTCSPLGETKFEKIRRWEHDGNLKRVCQPGFA